MRKLSRAIAFMLLSALLPASLFAQSPIPIRDGYVTEGFVGWTKYTDDLPGTIHEISTPRDPALQGAVVWVQNINTTDLLGAMRKSTIDAGFTQFKLEARTVIKKAPVLDRQATGETYIGTARRKGKTYRMAAIVLRFKWQENPRNTAIHVFAAPEEKFKKLGGWVVPASRFLMLDPEREIANSLAQGSASPKLQALRLANIADIWVQFVFDTYIQLAQANVQALSNMRQSVVCAGDPNCVIVQGY